MSVIEELLSAYDVYAFEPTLNDSTDLPNHSGFYMIGVKSKEALGDWFNGTTIHEFKNFPIIYIGVSGSQGLRKRFRNHLDGSARNSTLRKSLGSLFGWQADRVFDEGGKYKFCKNHEKELSSWMRSNLFIFYFTIHGNEVSKLETTLINKIDPPLNIFNNNSLVNKEFRTRLSCLRNSPPI